LSSVATINNTEALEPERQSAQSEARCRGLLEAALDAMLIVSQRDEIVLVNVQAEKRFGDNRDELIGRKVVDIIPIGFAGPLVADKLRSPAEALARTRFPAPGLVPPSHGIAR
jgi:PAS domain-containing protein